MVLLYRWVLCHFLYGLIIYYCLLQGRANNMSISLKMKNISKSFINKPIFENVSFNFDRGCYSVVGKNGVGKTILLEMLAGVLQQDTGSIYLNDVGLSTSIQYKKKLAYIPSKSFFFPSATGSEFLNFILSIKDINSEKAKMNSLISEFKLTEHLNTKFDKMSLGTQKKLFLTTLAIGDNSVIILDEPTNGLDTGSNEILYEFLSSIKNKAIIILATHDPILLKKLSPTIIELHKCPTTLLETNINYRYTKNEKII
jgi:ABC-2 type transport system ATP-binding protein